MNRFVFSSLITLGIFCTAVQENGFAAQNACTVGLYPKVLNNVRNMPKRPIIRVLLASHKPSFQIEVKGAHNVYDPYNGKKVEAAFLSSSYEMRPTSDGIVWGQSFPGVYQVVIVPDTADGVVIVDGIQYGGAVAFYQVENALSAVNWISLEDFTSSLVSVTMTPREREPKEALAAMIIALRSLAFNQILHSTNQFWDVRADACGYKGRAIMRLDIPFQEAMHSTKNIILEPKASEKKGVTLSDIEQLKKEIPYQQATELAEQGHDAAVILEKFMPNQQLQSVTQE